jgi:hypothetical protein
MTRNGTLALIGGGVLLGVVLFSRRATAASTPLVLSGVPQGDNGDPLANIAARSGQISKIAAIGGTIAKTLGISGAASAIAAPVLVAPTIGIGAATAAALPGAVALPVAPVAAESGLVGTVGVGAAAGQLAISAGLVAGIAALGYALDWWGATGQDCVASDTGEIIVVRNGSDDARCVSCDLGGCADTGAGSFVLAPDGSKVPTYGNVNLTTYEEAVEAGFGGGGY